MKHPANYRVTGPHGQGPVEVQGISGLNAVQNALKEHKRLFHDIDGIDEPRGPTGPVVAYRRVPKSTTMANLGAFQVAFLGWVGE